MLRYILFVFLLQESSTIELNLAEKFINPTGTYKRNESTKRNGDVYGYFGEIRIKLLDSARIAMTLWVCKGAPGYNSGSFVDTLHYNQSTSTSIYIPEDDSTCTITFNFTKRRLEVTQQQGNLNFGCGFGHGVFADGYYKKISGKVPVIEDLWEF